MALDRRPGTMPSNLRGVIAVDRTEWMRMPQYRIREEPTAISIELADVQGKQDELLQAFRECRTGQCSCPTDEYEKVAEMRLDSDEQQITIQLRPLVGERFDTDEIAACLDYTIANAGKPTKDS
jgi:hypothetical protein